jgi:hypothetical protein
MSSVRAMRGASRLVRNTSTEDNRSFWEHVSKTAAMVRSMPDWMRAGIEINEKHFTTFGARHP